MRLSAALIVRDESAHIEACLTCLSRIVDDIVVVDTGSTDRTPKIAAELGARVFRVPWEDDFARARNACLDHVSTPWVLYVDADERVHATGDLQPVLEQPDAIAGRVAFRAARCLTPYREHRLFRRRRDVRFRGVIHETVMPDINALVARGEGVIVDVPLTFEHLGYEGDITHKHHRNIPLLRRAVADDPERVYLWQTLGEAQLGIGDHVAAEAAWREGLTRIRSGRRHVGDVQVYANLLELHLGPADRLLPDADELAREMARHYPDDPLALWMSARFLAHEGRNAAARERAQHLIDMGPDGPTHGNLGYGARLFTAYPLGLIGATWLSDGEPERALSFLRRAEAAAPDELELRVKRVMAEGAVGVPER